MDRFAIFISFVASVSAVFLILALTFGLSRKYFFYSPLAISFLILSITLAAVAILGLIFYCVRRKPRSRGEDLMKFDLDLNLKADDVIIELPANNKQTKRSKKKEVDRLPLFSFSSVSTATNKFSDANKLGEGGFGPVYKGVLKKGDEIAVKRLSARSGQGLREMKNEASVIAKVQHKNLVRLLGCCIDKDEKILIYEYMPNKSLDFFLFDPSKRILLDWGTRVLIIEGIAQGFLYLHQYSRVRIIHRDLKASNILLDKDMNPKISDFGMARICGGNELQANTSRIVGTYGYMSPEYALEGVFSIKSDVFSFGVLLLEIVSGKKNTGFYRTDSLNLLGYAWDLWTSNRTLELIDDPVLEEEYSSKHMLLRYVNIALLCVQESADDRPTMNDVVSMLTNEAAALLPPKQPAFLYGLCSINFTTTRISPRKASSPEVPAHTDKSEYAGCFPSANPPTLKSDMKEIDLADDVLPGDFLVEVTDNILVEVMCSRSWYAWLSVSP
ncbi:Receptor-like serine/threonine-protein kinase [Citrus sinensis]|uniref:Receptor-like serine/threonine-protein kinase n=1 Tax=Citrus sinensis TaxID=2711 RepID=A0ACB8JDB3_CITSI|nr:Receptor-like serine/threonine-protein kinase [Citrus sinensis]